MVARGVGRKRSIALFMYCFKGDDGEWWQRRWIQIGEKRCKEIQAMVVEGYEDEEKVEKKKKCVQEKTDLREN